MSNAVVVHYNGFEGAHANQKCHPKMDQNNICGISVLLEAWELYGMNMVNQINIDGGLGYSPVGGGALIY